MLKSKSIIAPEAMIGLSNMLLSRKTLCRHLIRYFWSEADNLLFKSAPSLLSRFPCVLTSLSTIMSWSSKTPDIRSIIPAVRAATFGCAC